MPQPRTVERQVTPDRSPEEIAAAARNNSDLMRQVEESLEEERQGIPAISLQTLLEKARQRRSA